MGNLRYAVRQLAGTPAFTAAAVVSLALGIAVNSATFSVISALLLRPLASIDDASLVRIGRSTRGEIAFRSSSHRDLLHLREHATSLREVFGEQLQALTLSGPEGAEVVSGEIVSANYFNALGIVITRGRGLSDDDDRGGGTTVVVISDQLWRRRFGEDHAAVGRTVAINTRPFTIVGVAPKSFAGTFPGVRVDVWIPSMTAASVSPQVRAEPPALMLMGRLAPGASIGAAEAELDGLARQLARENPAGPQDRGFTIASAKGAHPLVARLIGPFLWLLLAIVVLVLLIASANVASLLLARATSRRGEFAIRLALGASRSKLVSQLLVESGLLGVVGAALGLALTIGVLELVNSLALVPGPTGAPVFLNLQVDAQVLAFTAAAAMLAVLAFGLMPAWRGTKLDLVSDIRGLGSVRAPRPSRLRSLLVAAQVALSTTLLIAAALLSRSLVNAASLDVGFDPDEVVVASFNLDLPGYDRAKAWMFHDALLARTRRLPAVAAVALADFIPMGDRGDRLTLITGDAGSSPGEGRLAVPYNRVSEEYFATLKQPLLLGREFSSQDRDGAPPVAIVNSALANRLWPDGFAPGRRIRIDGEERPREVVGIIVDARFGSLSGAVPPLVVLPARQRSGSMLTMHVRSQSGTAAMLAEIVRLAREIDPNIALHKGVSMRDAMAFSIFPAQVARVVFAVAGGIGLILASCGLYGLVSFTCARQLKDIGVMTALGASRRQVFRFVVGGTAAFVAGGLAVGAGLAFLAMRLFESMLFGVGRGDPLTFGAMLVLLMAATLLSSFRAARKGLNVDCIAALREP